MTHEILSRLRVQREREEFGFGIGSRKSCHCHCHSLFPSERVCAVMLLEHILSIYLYLLKINMAQLENVSSFLPIGIGVGAIQDDDFPYFDFESC